MNILRRRIASVMWEGVGILRDGAGLGRARSAMAQIQGQLKDGYFHRRVLETANMANLGDAIAACAEYRTESRGAHYRVDFPKTDDVHWKHPTRVVKEGGAYRFMEGAI